VAGGRLDPAGRRSPDKVRNSTLVFDDTGRRVARYDKVHLFGFERGASYDEAATIEAGNEVVAFEGPAARSGCRSATTCAFPSSSGQWATSA
jgi:nitrilase